MLDIKAFQRVCPCVSQFNQDALCLNWEKQRLETKDEYKSFSITSSLLFMKKKLFWCSGEESYVHSRKNPFKSNWIDLSNDTLSVKSKNERSRVSNIQSSTIGMEICIRWSYNYFSFLLRPLTRKRYESKRRLLEGI